ncbi:MAG: serine protease [Patescibacteria group bacterium]|mgnify:CR=1 FL=1
MYNIFKRGFDNSHIIESNRRAIGYIDVAIPDPTPNNPTQIKRGIRGTGFFINKDGLFATNAHVYKQVPDAEKKHLAINYYSRTDEKGIEHYVRKDLQLVKLDEEKDIAVFKIDEKSPGVVALGDTQAVQEGEEVLILGHPLATELMIMGLGVTRTADQCIVSAIKKRALDGTPEVFFVDTHINAGASGSPVFSKKTGKVIGIASGRIDNNTQIPNGPLIKVPANMGICRPVNYLANLIKAL